SELSFNARIAANLSAPIILAIKATGRSATELHGLADLLLTEISAVHATTAAIVVNRCEPELMVVIGKEVEKTGTPTWCLPEAPVL
ncbi:phosphate acetyltransferase, partial [Streptomyces sp. SID10244]|nr:phosphate acetyltransferase [Streptomyces sp. SID10244]